VNGHHLACSTIEASKDDEFIKHLKRFDNLNVYKVEAGVKSSFVCCEGEEELLTGRYFHSYAQCSECKIQPIVGPLHFVVDENNAFTYWCEKCAKKVDENGNRILPNLCFSIKG
jgi:hypothetical protein